MELFLFEFASEEDPGRFETSGPLTLIHGACLGEFDLWVSVCRFDGIHSGFLVQALRNDFPHCRLTFICVLFFPFSTVTKEAL